MWHIKSPLCNDILCKHEHGGSQLIQNRTSIKVRRTQTQAWLEIHTEEPSTEAGEWERWLTDVRCPTAVVEAAVKCQPRRPESRGTAAQKQNGTWGHTQSCAAHSTSDRRPCQQPESKHQVNTRQNGGGGRWWLIWISSFSDTGLFLHWYFTPLQCSNNHVWRSQSKWRISEKGKQKLIFLECDKWQVDNLIYTSLIYTIYL